MKIVLCDDDKIWLRKAEELLEAYGRRHAIGLTLDTYTDKNSMMRETEEAPDLLFMDIELGVDNGIQVVQEINQKWPLCEVVYLTNYLYYAMDVYETEHAYFLLKNEFAERLDKVFQKLQDKWKRSQEKLLFHIINGGELLLNVEEILYLERLERKTSIVTLHSELSVWEKLDDILGRLSGEDFVRCHNSYIISIAAVKEYRKDCFWMKNDKRIPISRSYKKQVQASFLQWTDREVL